MTSAGFLFSFARTYELGMSTPGLTERSAQEQLGPSTGLNLAGFLCPAQESRLGQGCPADSLEK